jgi:hypothetical protein
MNYYKIDYQIFFNANDDINRKSIGDANGEFVSDGRYYFDRIGKGEIIYDAPVFDYFHLESFDKQEYWEWRLQDVHGFIGVGSIMTAWYISNDFKLLLENFEIATKYHFYETKLLYKGEKLKYWIFQFPIEPLKNIDFQKSIFILDGEDTMYNFSSEEEYLMFYRNEYKLTKRKLKILTQVLKSSCDLFLSTNNDKIVTENLKIGIETMGLTGFEFSELDYEVVVDTY